MRVTRLVVLRSGYAALGFAFVALAASVAVPSLVLPGLMAAFLGGVLLAFSDEDLPKWAGIVLVTYFLLVLVAFVAATPITINKGDRYFVNKAPPELAGEVLYWMGVLSPIILSGVAILAAWERDRVPRFLLVGALGGFLLAATLTLALTPTLDAQCGVQDETGASASDCMQKAQQATNEARSRGQMLSYLTAASAATAALGTFWAAGRPDGDV